MLLYTSTTWIFANLQYDEIAGRRDIYIYSSGVKLRGSHLLRQLSCSVAPLLPLCLVVSHYKMSTFKGATLFCKGHRATASPVGQLIASITCAMVELALYLGVGRRF